MTYEATRLQVETYFDRTATKTWERLTSDAPVSGIRATVRAGRDEMRELLSAATAQRPARCAGVGCRLWDRRTGVVNWLSVAQMCLALISLRN
jgi:magnesium-protoporphyrin O-methyltransferase